MDLKNDTISNSSVTGLFTFSINTSSIQSNYPQNDQRKTTRKKTPFNITMRIVNFHFFAK